jgi:hypothetical protein
MHIYRNLIIFPHLSFFRAAMDKTKEEFVRFIKQAISEKDSDAFVELYHFLLGCFIRADTGLEGKVQEDQFDAMIEEAAALPRKYGYATKAEVLYPSEEERKAARAKMFRDMNTHKDGYITFEEWLSFSIKHIMVKVSTLSQDILSGAGTKEDFIAFMKKAVDNTTSEYRDLYFFLLKCFVDADRNHEGAVNPKQFDTMIEVAAAAPRRFGLAPESREMYKSEADRLSKRAGHFYTMNVRRDGRISFDEWLAYAMNHIAGKVASV